MAFTYDVTTDLGKTRLLAQDYDQTTHVFEDAEIQAFLDMNSANIRLGAAQALEVIAASEAYVSKKMVVDGDAFDGTAVAMALKGLATELRRQVMEGDADGAGLFDIAEQIFDSFTLRQRLMNDLLRKAGG